MKKSKKRDKIVNIFQDGSLLDANQVCEKLPSLDRATIYRNLNLLTEEGILRKVNLKEGISSYELAKEGDYHQHFICKNCEQIIPVSIDRKFIEDCMPAGIKLMEFEVNLKGECKDCVNS